MTFMMSASADMFVLHILELHLRNSFLIEFAAFQLTAALVIAQAVSYTHLELPPEHKKKVGAYVQGIREEMMEKNQKLL